MPLIPNGDFETGLTGWTATIPVGNDVSVTSLFPHQGLYAAQMTSLPGTTTTLTSTTTFSGLPADTYSLSFSLLWYVDYRQAQTFTMYATFTGAGGAVVGAATLPVVANWGLDQYTAYTSSTCLTGTASTMTLAFALAAGSQGCRVMLDDVSSLP